MYAAADESTPGFLREKGVSYHTEISNPERRFSRDAWPIGLLLPGGSELVIFRVKAPVGLA
jgi:hypothetical protein